METGLNASACVCKQPIMVATASIEHPIGCCQTQRTQRTQLTQAIAFGWNRALSKASDKVNHQAVLMKTNLWYY